MRLSVVLMILGLAGVLAGAGMIGRAVFGLAVIADSVALIAYGLWRDVPSSDERNELMRRRAERRIAA